VSTDHRRSRPGFDPNYGISDADEGMLDWGWAEERLAASRSYWVVTTSESGAPSVAPVWGLWREGAVLFGTNPRSTKGRNLSRDPRVVIHLESGDEVVILHGEIDRYEIDDAIADAYRDKYDFRPEPGKWYRLQPSFALAWLETDYPKTATRFDFDA
jgi:pyridoxine/pyridoxamine 5'-phosphate oxidase